MGILRWEEKFFYVLFVYFYDFVKVRRVKCCFGRRIVMDFEFFDFFLFC